MGAVGVTVIDLEERTDRIVAESVARLVLQRHPRAFAVGAPDALGQTDWSVCSKGLVGYLPLDRTVALRIAPKVPVQSVLGMIELAYDLPSLTWQAGLAAQGTVEGLFETLVMILARRVNDRLRRGLYRAYVEERDELQAVRGRVLPRESLARAARGSVSLVCDYEDLTENLRDNQILLWTLERVRRAGLARSEVAQQVRIAHRTLSTVVDLVPVRAEECAGRAYHQLNGDYRFLHVLCGVLIEATGASTGAGSTETVPFTVDMARLFELFVARWLVRVLPDLTVEAHVPYTTGGFTFNVDVVLREEGRGGRARVVLDTKYKDHGTPKPDDVQQVVFYAEALRCTEAWLVYPRPVRTPAFKVGDITVRTFGLDLARPVHQLDVGPMRAVLGFGGAERSAAVLDSL